MEDTMEVSGVLYGAPIDGVFDGEVFPDGLKVGDDVIVRWADDLPNCFAGPYSVPNIWAGEGSQFRAPVNHPIYAAVSDDTADTWGDEIAVTGKPVWLDDYNADIQAKWPDKWARYYYATSLTEADTWGSISAIRLPVDHWAYVPLAKGFTPWAGGDEEPGDWAPYGEVLFADGSTSSQLNGWAWGALIIGYKPKTPAAWQTSPTYRPDDVVTIEAPASQSFKAGDYVVALEGEIDIVAGNVYVMIDSTYFTDEAGDERPITARPVRPATPEEIAAYKAQSAPDNGAELAAVFTNTYERETVTIPKMTEDEAAELWHSYRGRRDTTTTEDALDMLRSLGIIRSPTSIEAFEAHHGGLDNNQRAIIEIYQEWFAAQ